MKMKSKKIHNNKIIYIIIIVLLLILIAVTILLQKLKKDSDKNNNTMQEIKATYQQLEMNISTYNEIRNNLVTNLENYYTENLTTDYSKFIDYLTQEETTILNIKTNIDNIEQNCQDRIFTQKEVNTICNTYKEYYEKVVNIFINDQKQINNIINTYNETEEQSLEVFQPTQIKDYIDYNKDGKYLEREDQ